MDQLSLLAEDEQPCRFPLHAAATAYRYGCRCGRCLAGKQDSQRLSPICETEGCTELRLKGYHRCAKHKPVPLIEAQQQAKQRTRKEAVCEIPGCKQIHTWYESQLQTSVRPDLQDLYRRTCHGCRNLYMGVIRTHNLNADQAIRLIMADCCDLCGEGLGRLNNGRRNVVVDHDHGCCDAEQSCGRCVRGFVHPGCNTMIGNLEKITRTMGVDRVIAYVSEWHMERQAGLRVVPGEGE